MFAYPSVLIAATLTTLLTKLLVLTLAHPEHGTVLGSCVNAAKQTLVL
jgi:hypothetical protein